MSHDNVAAQKARSRAHYLRHREANKARARLYYAQNKEKAKDDRKRYVAKNRAAISAANKLRYAARRAAGVYPGVIGPIAPRPEGCEVCGAGPLNLDHDHATGKFRGWLCSQCNMALGLVKDSPKRLRALAAYLGGYHV